jgi:secondary thiamine-phosphate synthase enzyme
MIVIPAKAGIQDTRRKSGTISNTGHRFSPVRRLFTKPLRIKGKKMIHSETISLSTKGFSDIIDITHHVDGIISRSGIDNGLVTVFCPGSTGAITTIEYESGVLSDLQKAIEKIAPSNIPYEHDKRWGDGNGFSHVRAALIKPSLSIPLAQGRLALGTWQQIVFIDFDNRKRNRNILVHIIGE